jgi:hypothetical protein
MVWELVFMLLILKIPIVYLCVVVWWAIKAEPAPPDLEGAAIVADTPPTGGWPHARRRTARRRPMRPHTPGRGGGGPAPQREGTRL